MGALLEDVLKLRHPALALQNIRLAPKPRQKLRLPLETLPAIRLRALRGVEKFQRYILIALPVARPYD